MPDAARPLAGRRALITGGGTGVGADLARGFAGAGAEVVVAGRRRDPLDRVAADAPEDKPAGERETEFGIRRAGGYFVRLDAAAIEALFVDLFLDAHAEHRYVDSRYPFGDGWTAWPAPN